MCALQLDVKHTDVLILSQFVRSDGCMLPRRITGLCARQQKKIGKMVSMAQKAGMIQIHGLEPIDRHLTCPLVWLHIIFLAAFSFNNFSLTMSFSNFRSNDQPNSSVVREGPAQTTRAQEIQHLL